MKLFWMLTIYILVFGCDHKVAPVSEPNTVMASADDCNKVYNKILALKVKETYPEAQGDEAWASSMLLDNYLREDGTTQRFFDHCIGYMNSAQVDCALQSTTFSGLNACHKFFKSPTKEHK